MYYRQQNKCYLQSYLLAHFEVKLDFKLKLIFLPKLTRVKLNFVTADQISLLSVAVNCSFSGNMTPLKETYILLAIAHWSENMRLKCRKRLRFHRISEFYCRFHNNVMVVIITLIIMLIALPTTYIREISIFEQNCYGSHERAMKYKEITVYYLISALTYIVITILNRLSIQ